MPVTTPATHQTDLRFLREAVDLAITSVAKGGGPFGAVIVQQEQIVGRGHNQVTLNNDPTAHAEIMAIRHACQTLKNFSLTGCTLYTSCEPCPMCMAAIYWARIDRVVYAASGEDAARAGFDDTLIARELCLPHACKIIPVEHCVCENHTRSFSDWMDKNDKTKY
jgi:tRNA(Arg) A34 adenosine deaminase TadA